MTLDELSLKKSLIPGLQSSFTESYLQSNLGGCGSAAPPAQHKRWLWWSKQADDDTLVAHPSLLIVWKRAEV